MRILYIATSVFRNTSASIRNVSLINGLVELGNEIDILTLDYNKELEDKYLVNYINNLNVDIHKIKIPFFNSIKKREKDYKIEDKKNFIYRLKAKIETYLEDKISNKYDLFVVLTNEDKIKWKNSKVEVIPNFLEKYPTKISELKNKKIISVGRLDYQKGFDLLIDVFEKVTRVHPEWKLEIYGEGEEKEKLNEKIKNKNLDGNIKLNGVTIEIGKKYIEASIYVMSSRYEGFGMVLLEAQAYGLPIVSFNCPCGPKDIITANKNGFLCNFGNIDDMAEKIIYLIDNIEIRKNFGKKARENSLEYSEEKIMEKWENLLQVLIKE